MVRPTHPPFGGRVRQRKQLVSDGAGLIVQKQIEAPTRMIADAIAASSRARMIGPALNSGHGTQLDASSKGWSGKWCPTCPRAAAWRTILATSAGSMRRMHSRPIGQSRR